ncbi:MAG: NUDIX hydrolase [Rhodospirillales bacterium]|nr:NUDIX hydrolase [Rhodospirillales bacterium]
MTAAPPPEIETLSSRIAYENRWMRVREDRIRRRDGSEGLYGVVEKPDFAVIVPSDGARLHLVQQFRYPVGARFWEFPQGAWESAPDADPADLARGELAEETGLIAAEMIHIGHLFQGYGYSNQGGHVFLARGLTQGPSRREPEEQGMVARDFALAEVEAMLREGVIRDAISVAAFGLLRLRGLV